jgi:hypothetical protein
MPRRGPQNPFRLDPHKYQRGQTARIVGRQVLAPPSVQSLHHRTLAGFLGQQWEARSAIIAGWPTHRIHGFLQLLAEELRQVTATDKDRLELLWEQCIAVLQSRV